jgi:hypothetical protein
LIVKKGEGIRIIENGLVLMNANTLSMATLEVNNKGLGWAGYIKRLGHHTSRAVSTLMLENKRSRKKHGKKTKKVSYGRSNA